jgi:outer membrane lipoprotein SlyB
MTMTTRFLSVLALIALLLLGGCASAPPGAGLVGNGVVQSIAEAKKTDTAANVVGAVGGAVLGSWLGSGIGGGTGKTVATVAGGVGGAMAGSAVAGKVASDMVWDVVVRFEDGIDRAIRVTEAPTYRPGDRVTVSNGIITLRR